MPTMSLKVCNRLQLLGLVFVTLSKDMCHSTVTNKNESYLIRQVLLKDYEPAVRPVLKPEQSLRVNISIGIKTIIEIDMKEQLMKSFGWLTVDWYDASLTWNASEYEISNVFLTGKRIWRPELVIFNTLQKLDELEGQAIKVNVMHDGKVRWFAGGLFKTVCSIDISRYPVDTQSCSIEVISWSLSERFLGLRFADEPFEIAQMDNHPEWTLVDIRAEYVPREYGFPFLRFVFTLKRKVLFYVINIILPIVLLSLMNCLVFLLPVESGEKMTVSVTVFLSFAVFMSLINDSLPQNSDSLCLFNAYVAVQMFLSVCSIVMATVIVFVFDKDKNDEVESRRKSCCCHCRTTNTSVMQHAGSPAVEAPSVRDLAPEFMPEGSPSVASVSSSLNRALSASDEGVSPASSTANSSLALCRGGEASPEGPKRCPLSVRTVWRLVRKAQHGTAEDRRELAKALDRVSFVLNICLNLFSGLVFIALMVYS